MEKINILHTNFLPHWVGESSSIITVCKLLKEKNFNVFLASPPNSTVSVKAKELGINLIPVNFSRGFRPQYDVPDIADLVKFIKNTPIDILHTHGSKDSWLTAPIMRFLKPKVKIVRTRHNIFPVSRHPLNRWLYCTVTDHLVVVSNYIQENFLADNFVSSENITVISDGIDLEKFSPSGKKEELREKFSIKKDALLVGMVGGFVKHKGHKILLKAFTEVAKKKNVELILAGDGDDNLIDLLKAEAEEKKIKVYFAGFQKDVPSIMEMLDLFAMPSLQEGLGLVAREAMAMGLPVVASNVGGIPDSVRDNETGLLVSPNSDELAEGMLKILDNPELARDMGKKGREHAQRNFSQEAMLSKTIELYEKITRYA